MAGNPSKKNLVLENDELHFSSEMEAFFYSNSSNPVINGKDDEDGGSAGTSTLSVEQLLTYFQALFNKLRRQLDGQAKFGVCPLSEDPNNLLGKGNSRSCEIRGQSPKNHPLLSYTQQFSGIDDKLNPIPAENSEASKHFPEKRLENQLRKQKKLGLEASNNVTLAR